MNINDVFDYLDEIMPDWYTPSDVLMLTLTGSRGYGLHNENSDWDYFAVVAPPEEYIIGSSRWEGVNRETDNLDIKVYSPAKYMSMCMQGSVNNLEPLFLPTLYKTTWMNEWLDHAETFVTKATLASILGYTLSTKKRYKEVGEAQHGKKRKTLIEAYGYDGSAAAHCVRWLWMGLDLARNKGKRLDPRMGNDLVHKEIVKSIKRGEYSADAVDEIIASKENTLVNTYKEDLEKRLGAVDRDVANHILINLHKKIIGCSRTR